MWRPPRPAWNAARCHLLSKTSRNQITNCIAEVKIPTPKPCLMHGRRYWRVRIGARHGMGWTGTRQFGTRAEAVEFIKVAMQQRKQLGEAAANLSPAQLLEAAACMARLAAAGATLTGAVDFYLTNSPTVCGQKTVQQLGDEFLASRRSRGCKDTTLSEYKSKIGAIQAEFGKVIAHAVLTADIEDWLDELDVEPRTKLGYLKAALTLWNFGIKRGCCIRNPVANIDQPICQDREPGILTPTQLSDLMRAAVCDGGELVRPIVIGAFGGARRSEIFSLDEHKTDLAERLIEITAGKSKTRQRRLISINPTLAAWLAAFPPTGHRVVSIGNIDVFGQELRRVAALAGINPWPHNALRHSFGSYFLAKTANENVTAAEMGNSPGVVIKHYRAIVKPVAADAYWKVLPEITSNA